MNTRFADDLSLANALDLDAADRQKGLGHVGRAR